MRTHASFFSGIGAFDLGLERAGFAVVSHAEVKPYSNAVLETRWPGIPNLGDINAICPDGDGEHECEIPRADVWSGGFPCSDFSVMGKRKGLLGGNRSSLGLVFLDLVRRHRPPFVVLENVPGLLTSHEGRDFGLLLGTLVDIGYGWSYRLLDARNFGLPQARRRLFVVATADPDDAGAVLDDGTYRRLDAPAIGGPSGAAVAGGRDGAAERVSIVLGPTYAPSSDAIVRTDGTTFTITPNNYQYVLDEPLVLAGVFPKRAEQRSPSRRDGTSYTLTPGVIPYILEPGDFDDLPGRDGDLGYRDGADRAGRRLIAPSGDHGSAGVDDSDDRTGPTPDSDRVRAAPGIPGWLDDSDGGGSGEVGPQSLDAARWHVLGRACPVPIVEWIGAGIMTVLDRKSS